MLNKIIERLLLALLDLLPEDILKKSLSDLLLSLERNVKESKSKLDDAIILPIIAYLRRELL